MITGNMGYVGSVLVRHLREVMPDAFLIGYDSGFFAHCLTGASFLPETMVDYQYFGDVRNISDRVFHGLDAVVHLAAISNDPMGSRFEVVTHEVNYQSSVDIARKALIAGATRFVFASSCSMYGYAEGNPRKETDPLNPLTAYARSKTSTEQALKMLDLGNAVVTSLRFGTACGLSDRLRLDLVLNDFVASAVGNGKITVLSDGSPWRPLIDVKDMARAIEWALIRDPKESGQLVFVNVGSDDRNYQVWELASAVADAIPETKVVLNTSAPPDRRSYQVDFSLYKEIAPHHQPEVTLSQTIEELKDGLKEIGFHDVNFRSSQYMRLKVLEDLIAKKSLSEDLYWTYRLNLTQGD